MKTGGDAMGMGKVRHDQTMISPLKPEVRGEGMRKTSDVIGRTGGKDV
jgi:hypothetical protein